jgi:translation initiation factor 4E
MVDPAKYPNDSNLRLFKRGIKPMWEDAANIQGGRWVITCKKDDTSQVFMNLMLCVIGEQFKYNHDVVCAPMELVWCA